MTLVAAFIRMIRLPNLFFIALTQFLFQYCIIIPIFKKAGAEPVFTIELMFLLMLSSVMIAAAGYIINDYFDINIDQVNKPRKNVVDNIISRRWAMLWHSLLSLMGVIIGFYIGWRIGVFWMGFMNFICVALLFFYSTTFKKRLLSGNLIISLLTAWSVAVLGLATFYVVFYNPDGYHGLENNKLLRFTILYSSFAFIISVIREAIKDMEDLPGDAKYGCRTMPIVWGLDASKIYTAVWLCVLLGALIIVEIYLMQYAWWWPVVYGAIAIAAVLFQVLRKLFRAKTPEKFHQLSNLTKFAMLTGILSMIVFYFYL